MNSGPSKEQIDNFYRTSRKYFDELAKQYYEKDREFYNKYFAPYYSNPLLSARKKTSGGKTVIVVSLILFLITTAVIGIIFLTIDSSENKREQEVMKYIDEFREDEHGRAKSMNDSLSLMDSISDEMQEPLIPNETRNDGGSKSARDKGRKPQ